MTIMRSQRRVVMLVRLAWRLWLSRVKQVSRPAKSWLKKSAIRSGTDGGVCVAIFVWIFWVPLVVVFCIGSVGLVDFYIVTNSIEWE